jgi:hypothetical protein
MAEWVEANLRNLLPDTVETILDLADVALTATQVPLEVVNGVLQVASAFLLSLDAIFPPSQALKTAIEDFKNDILQSGLYICSMWDYPVRQLEPSAFGPAATFGTFGLDGSNFVGSFLSELDQSFDDEYDLNRPQFTGEVAMFVIVTASRELSEVGLSMGEDNSSEGWKGLRDSIGLASKGLEERRWGGAWAKLLEYAESLPSDKVATRKARIVAAFRRFRRLRDVGPVQIPQDINTGAEFFEGLTNSSINWDLDVVPLLESIEELAVGAEYPDWSATTLRDIYPDMVVILDTVFDPIIELLEVGGTILGIFNDLIASIKEKLSEIEVLLAKVESALDEIELFLDMTGFYAIYVTSDQGVTGARQKLLAADSPFEDTGFFSGMAVLAGSANVEAFKTLFSGIGD